MIIFKKNTSRLFFGLTIIFFISFFIIFFDGKNFKKMIDCKCIGPGVIGNIEQRLRISLNQPILFKTPSIEKNMFLDYSKKLFFAIQKNFFNRDNFEEIKLNIPLDQLLILKKDREKALNLGKLIEPNKVDLRISHRGKSYNATARLKGDLPEHWQNYNQWSLKFKLKKGRTIFSMNEFSTMIHSERDFPYNFLLNKIYKHYGLLTPDYKTIKLNLNGDNWGLMLMEEMFGENFYFKNRLKEAPIFKMTNEDDFLLQTIYGNQYENIDDIVKWQGKFETKIYNEKKILSKSTIPSESTNKNLVSIFKNIQLTLALKDQKFLKQIIKYLNLDDFAKVMAISSSFGDFHGLLKNNSRYYINPYDLKIRPIITDQIHGKKIIDETYFESIPILYKYLLSVNQFKDKYINAIKDINENYDLFVHEAENVCKIYGKNCENLFQLKIIKKNIEYVLLNQNEIFKTFYKSQYKKSDKRKLNTININNVISNKIYFRFFSNGDLQIYNLTGEKIKIDEIILKDDKNKYSKKIKINKYINPSLNEKITVKNIKLDLNNKFEQAKLIYSDEKNKNFALSTLIERDNFKPENFFVKENEYQHKFIEKKEDFYIIPSGNHNIYNPIIIPNGFNLKIRNGTILNMSPNSYIQVKNGSIICEGSKNAKIKIKSIEKGKKWKGMYVNSRNNKKNISRLNHVTFSDLNYFNTDKIQLTGSINFINSELKILNTQILNSLAEDAINIVNSNVEISNLIIENTLSDGVDIDFGIGSLKNINFYNIGGDAIDLSGSNISVSNMFADKIGDKAISVGEKSDMIIDNVKITNSKIGIAGKDSSTVIGENINIKKCRDYDFAVYVKKNYFAGAKMNLKKVEDCGKHLVQDNSYLMINNKSFKSKKFNSKILYN